MIRRATPHDAEEIGRVFVRTRDLMAYLPRIPDEDRPKLGGWIIEPQETWVDDQQGRVVGFIGLGVDMLDHIYVDPDWQNRGIGTELLDFAKQQRPHGFQLWVFQKNEGARRFYERHGFRLVELTEGAGNVEKEPDARYEWLPTSRGSSGR